MRILATLTLLAAIGAAPIKVGAPDQGAMLGGRGARVVLDGPCRAADVVRIADLTGCAEDLATGSPGPVLLVAAARLTRGNPNYSPLSGLALLNDAAARRPHPATNYALGAVLSDGEVLPPRFAMARDFLALSHSQGNAAAAAGLGELWQYGKGGSQDVAKAGALYETALAGGFMPALRRLIEFHSTGRWTAADPARVEALLKAAETAGYLNVPQLRADVASAAKMTNVQTIPPIGDGPPLSIAYTGFEQPELPPSIGFDSAFQKVYRAPFDDPTIAADLKARLPSLPTPYIYELARRIAPSDPREALILYRLGTLRLIYDGKRCADSTAAQGLNLWQPFMFRGMAYALRPATESAGVDDEVLAREAALPADTVPLWICYHGIAGVQAGLDSKKLEPLLVPAARWPALRASARASLADLPPRPR